MVTVMVMVVMTIVMVVVVPRVMMLAVVFAMMSAAVVAAAMVSSPVAAAPAGFHTRCPRSNRHPEHERQANTSEIMHELHDKCSSLPWLLRASTPQADAVSRQR